MILRAKAEILDHGHTSSVIPDLMGSTDCRGELRNLFCPLMFKACPANKSQGVVNEDTRVLRTIKL
ncbi:hypothetical protein EAF00_011716 [Botryotinia globosa]|nr:hypothetical protein EAF00_011716 [Botryotinia globosa]